MGMFVVHGAQAGGFSPISIYGTITNSVMRENGLPVNELALFLISLLVNLAIAVVLFLALGGRDLVSRRIDPDEPVDEPVGQDGEKAGAGTSAEASVGGVGTRQRTDPETQPQTSTGVRVDQVVTLVAFALVALIALVFDKNIGFAAITAAVVLTALFPAQQKGAVSQIAWATVLLVAGVSTFAAILEAAGVSEYVGTWAAGLGTAVLGALILCYLGGVVSAFASSTALLPIIIPIAIPLVTQGDIGAVALVSAVAVSSTIVDVSPFSTNGALMLANRPDTITEERYYRQILGYSAIVVAIGPLLVWAAVVLPGWR
jgi:hypothetical protein